MLYKSDIKEVFVSLWITGFDFHPDEITKQLGVQPTETQIKDEYRVVGKGKHQRKRLNKENRWRLISPLSQRVNPDKHLEYILKIIKRNKEKFVEVFKKYDSEISFGIYWGYCNPGITLDNSILRELSELNIEVGFDMYYLE